MPVQKLKIIGRRSVYQGVTLKIKGVSLSLFRLLAQFWRLVQQWKYPAQLRDSFLEWMRDIFNWIRTPVRAQRSNSSKLPLLPLISLTKIKRFPRPPGPVRWAAASVLLIFIPIVLVNLLFPSQPAAWYNSSWVNRKSITVDPAQVAGSSDLTDYPMLVSITDTDVLASAQADADDILFTSADGLTQLDHEIESYDSGTGALVAWVRIPTLDFDNDTVIYMYYGNAVASNQQNATGVWDSNYAAVWHMNQASGTLMDSTSNNNDIAATATPDYAQAGKIGTSINFDGSSEYFSGSITNLPTGNTNYTIESWYNADTTGNRAMVGWGAFGSTRQVTAFRLNSSTGYAHYWWGDDHIPTQALSTATWTYAAAHFDGTTRRTIHNTTVITNTPGGTHNATSANFRLGSANSGEYWDGKLDEVRISRVARSTDWMATSYNNQSSPGTFYSLGTQETEDVGGGGDWFDTNWGYRQTITITNNGTTQTSYQVQALIDTGSLYAATKLQADCDDIRFTTTANVELDYWNEYCDTGSGNKSSFWVTVPSISTGTTDIYVYYGNSAATAVSAYTTLPTGINIGTGKDGAITVSSNTDINTANSISGRSCADGGDAVNYSVTENRSAGTNQIVLSTTPSAGCLVAGDEILVINLQGATGNIADVGEYETARITTISTATLTLNHNLQNGYNGTNQKIMVQRVPNYSNVTVNSSIAFTPTAWNGTKGGVMMFRANGTATVTGTIHANALGYRGGTAVTGDTQGNTGENLVVSASGTSAVNHGAGGGKAHNPGVCNPSAGGGGGHAASGSSSTNKTNSCSGGGLGGGTVGSSDLASLFMGGGGGSGGGKATSGTASGAGGAGGGIVFIQAATLSVSGGASANGGNGAAPANTTDSGGDGGGGGAGGSVHIMGNAVTLGTSVVAATAGSGNTSGTHSNGGNGAVGRIKATYSTVSGTSNPSATTLVLPITSAASSEETAPVTNPIVNTLGAELTADANLVGHWKFDDNTGTTSVSDSSGNSLTGTMNGTMTAADWVPGKYGSALDFDGTNDSILVSNTADPTAFSYAAWVKPTDVTSVNIITRTSASGPTTDWSHQLRINASSKFEFYAWDGSAKTMAGTTTVVAGQWYHIAVSVQNGSVARLYVNGIQEGTPVSITTLWTSGDRSYIGSNSGGSMGWYAGLIDDVRFYSDVRTPGEIVMDMNAGHPLGGSPIASQALYWGLDEQQGQTTYNRGFGSSMNGTLGTSTGASTDDPTWKTAADCKVNGCLSFDGGDYVKTANNALDGLSTQASFSVWFKTSSTGENLIFSNEGYHGVYMNFGGVSGKMTAFFDGSSGGNPSTALSYNDNTWHHLVATNNGTTTKLYVDGKKVLDFSETFAAATSTQPLVLGAQYTGATSFYTGSLDEMKVYGAALSDSEILIDLNAGSAVNFNTGTGLESAQIVDGPGNPPVANWNLDENTGTVANDISGNSYTGTLTNGPVWTNGKVGQALNFDGTDDYVSTTLASNAQTIKTISVWFKSDDAGSIGSDFVAQRFVTTLRGTTSTRFALGINNNKIAAFWYDGANNLIEGTTTLSPATWYHAALTEDGTTLRLYLDGQLENSAAESSISTATSDTVTIGRTSNSSATRHFDGVLDNIQLYNYARTQAQVAYDYNRGEPIGWWKLDECTGTTAYNSSGAGPNGTVTIGASGTYTSAGTCGSGTSTQAWNAGTTGRFNGGIGFDGTDDFASMGSNAAFALSQFSVGLWTKKGSGNTVDILFSNGPDNSAGSYRILTTSSGIPSCLAGATGSAKSVDGSTALTNGSWYHLAATYDGTTLRCYVNGVLIGSSSTGTYTPTTLETTIGKQPNTGFEYYADAMIDDVRLYNYALSASQIQQAMNLGTTFFGPATGSP